MSVAQQAEVIELPLSMVERLEALLGRLESRLAMPDAGEGILTTEEAMALARCRSTSAFCRWTKTWSVRAAGKNRWPRHRIEAGKLREAQRGGRSSTSRHERSVA